MNNNLCNDLENIAFQFGKDLFGSYTPDYLVHYTNTAGLKGILDSKQFRLKRASAYKNHEFECGKILIRKYLLDIASQFGTDIETHPIYDACMNHPYFNPNNIYIGCFTSETEFSQWQVDDHKYGGAFVFNTKYLHRALGGGITKVFYTDQSNILNNFILKVMNLAHKENPEHVAQYMSELMLAAYTLKHSRFKWEKEWRVRVTKNDSNIITRNIDKTCIDNSGKCAINNVIEKVILGPKISQKDEEYITWKANCLKIPVKNTSKKTPVKKHQ